MRTYKCATKNRLLSLLLKPSCELAIMSTIHSIALSASANQILYSGARIFKYPIHNKASIPSKYRTIWRYGDMSTFVKVCVEKMPSFMMHVDKQYRTVLFIIANW